ncbi:MAG: hypothetical protein LPK14_10535 [Hymenobacteraceae bacterium]|nr:hypothetical protein [Hymenobacteraceae bacterium]
MLSSRIKKHYLRYPLMWVMLLWALTLPGHELAVYSFLVKGSVAEVAPRLFPATPDAGGATSIKQQAVQAFPDANTVAPLVLSPLLATRCLLQFFAFASLTDDLPVYSFQPGGAELLTQLFPVTIQPNAP